MWRAATLAGLLALAGCRRDEPPPPAPPPPATDTPPPAEAKPRGALHPPSQPDWGEPDMKKLRRLFRARAGQIRACYESALQREPTTSGRFTLRFTITPGGAVEDVDFASSTFRRRDVPRCIADLVRGWKTPFRPSEPVAVEYPLRFTPL